MKKKVISILILMVLLLNLIPISLVQAAGEKVTVTVTADKTNAYRGEEITYTIAVEATVNITTVQLKLDIPSGLTYVENSGAMKENLATELGIANSMGAVASFEETPKKVIIANDTPLTLNGKVAITTFKCKVDDTASGDYTVGVKDVDIADENFDGIPEAERKMVSATTKVVVPVTGVSLNKKEIPSLDAGTSETLVATIAPTSATNKKVTWKSSDTSVATVSESGVVTGVKKGFATITVTTEDGSYSATCNVTVVCAHTETTTHPAVPSTCKEQGNKEYVTCDACNEVITGSDEKLPLADHNYGTLIPEVDPVHEISKLEDGTKAHYKCSVCEKLFDENKKEVTAEDLVIKAPSHTYGDWEVDTTDHWKECGCGNIVDQAAHTGGEATCTEKAKCEVCDVAYGSIDSTNHVNTEVKNKVEAGCTTGGYTGDTYCNDCKITVETGKATDPNGHTGGTATCTEKAVCGVCDTAYGEIDSENHVNTELKGKIEETCTTGGYSGDTYCNDCKETVEIGKVTDPKPHTGEATCISKAVCEDCDTEFGEIDSTNHVNTELRDAVEATTSKKGYTGDVYCKDCDTLVEKGKVIPMKEDTTDPTKPQTDDNSNMMLWVTLLVISGISFVGIAKCNTKRRISKHSK